MLDLSLIIATYNRAEQLMVTLESVATQRHPAQRWECIVVDNNSKDDTRERVEAFAAAHSDLQLRYVFESNQGLSYARNRGIEEAKGEIIAFVDDDERIVEEFVAAYVELFASHRDAMSAGGKIIAEYPTGRPHWMSKYAERPIANPMDFGQSIKPFPKGRIPGGGNMAMRRVVFERIGMFDTSLGRTGKQLIGGEESDLFARLRREGVALYFVPKAAIYHHIPDTKLTVEYIERLSLNVGKSKRMRAEADGKLCFLILKESLKQVATYLIAAGYLICLKPKKAHFLLKMRRGIMAGVKSK